MRGRTVWLSSFPKSGNTWWRAMLASLGGRDPFGQGGMAAIAANRERLDQALGLLSTDLSRDEFDALRPLADETLDREQAAPHVRKIHDALVAGPSGDLVVSLAATRCAIYLIRDPRDVAVSYARHLDRDPSWMAARIGDPALEIAGDPRDVDRQGPQRIGDWSGHVRSWTGQAAFPVLVVRYEDCRNDPLHWFAAGLDFAGLEYRKEDLRRAVEASSFDTLRARELAEGFIERTSATSAFFRRGQVGSWRDELDPESRALIERHHGEEMARWGYL